MLGSPSWAGCIPSVVLLWFLCDRGEVMGWEEVGRSACVMSMSWMVKYEEWDGDMMMMG
jgi:hypothetical protein